MPDDNIKTVDLLKGRDMVNTNIDYNPQMIQEKTKNMTWVLRMSMAIF